MFNNIRELIFGFFGLLTTVFLQAQVMGCTDPLAGNFNALATQNDGTCNYAFTQINPVTSRSLTAEMVETSGLINWNNRFWTHNDNSDLNLYAFELNDIPNFQTTSLNGTINVDWEEISQDSAYVYLGNFGNNANGNRTDLKILRVSKSSILANLPAIDSIQFSYSLQTNFNPTGANQTNFDCESFIVTDDSIYLFTKEWLSQGSSIYALPKQPGTYVAQFRGFYNVGGLITGATFVKGKNLIVLSGYSTISQPFLYLLYDFQNRDFFKGNKRKISVYFSAPHQVEGITTLDGLTCYISNEKLDIPPFVLTYQKIHELDLSPYLGNYLTALEKDNAETDLAGIRLYPNPVDGVLTIDVEEEWLGKSFEIADLSGKTLYRGKLNGSRVSMLMESFSPGLYWFVLDDLGNSVRKIIKR